MAGKMTDKNEFLKLAIRDWWAKYPMTYGLEHGSAEYTRGDGSRERVEIGSRLFFEKADETFYDWNEPRHDGTGKFGKIFDYGKYAGQPVLEIGCGMGCMAMNWAQHGASVTAVDINPVAVKQTRRRFEAFGLDGDFREADAENLPFPDDSFSFAYSWGVLHHTPGTKKGIDELFRVLKPGGRCGVMLYNRNSLYFLYMVRYMEGFVNMQSRWLDPVGLASRYGDGAVREGNPHTWPVTKQEIRNHLFTRFANLKIEVFGTDIPSILDLWFPRLGSRILPSRLIDSLARRWGWSLWITGEKPSRQP
jgi:ubiquinone/menaquinone biosynthesis C-methylase UbiE